MKVWSNLKGNNTAKSPGRRRRKEGQCRLLWLKASGRGPQVLDVDTASGRVRVQAGARVQDVVEALRPHGLTLQNYASIREQQIGGFTQACRFPAQIVTLWPPPLFASLSSFLHGIPCVSNLSGGFRNVSLENGS